MGEKKKGVMAGELRSVTEKGLRIIEKNAQTYNIILFKYFSIAVRINHR